MTAATWAAVLLLIAGLLHSISFMCRKLPPAARPRFYPRGRLLPAGIDALWIALFAAALTLAFRLSTGLGITAAVIYFAALPFALQPSLARLMGFRNLRHYLEEVDRQIQGGKEQE